MGQKFVGTIILTVNGLPILHVEKYSFKTSIKREPVQGMTPTGDPAGYAEGSKSYTWSADVAIPSTGDIDWTLVVDAVFAVVNASIGSHVTVATGVTVTEVGAEYSNNGKAMRNLSGFALTYTAIG